MVIEASEPHQGQTKFELLLMLLLLLGSSFLLVVEIYIHKVSTMSDTDRQNGKRLMDMFLVEELLYFVVVVVVVDLYVKGGEASHDYSSLLKHMI